jgi:regulator of RNase E activity RraA
MLTHAQLLELKRWNTPTIYNGWEQITDRNAARECFNHEPVTDYMPQMGAMVGYAITVRFEPSNPTHRQRNPKAWAEYREYVASIPGPKVVVVQDMDKPACVGAFWGEVNSNIHRALGCVGTITDGAIRDVDEMTNAGFKALARRMCIGHAHSCPVAWNCPVEVFGTAVEPGQLIHADKHGFLAVPREDQERLLEAARFMDSNECQTIIPAARSASGLTARQILEQFEQAAANFGQTARRRFNREGEWSNAPQPTEVTA